MARHGRNGMANDANEICFGAEKSDRPDLFMVQPWGCLSLLDGGRMLHLLKQFRELLNSKGQ